MFLAKGERAHDSVDLSLLSWGSFNGISCIKTAGMDLLIRHPGMKPKCVLCVDLHKPCFGCKIAWVQANAKNYL